MKTEFQEFQESEFNNYENRNSELLNSEFQEFRKSEPNNNKINNNNYTENQSIYPNISINLSNENINSGTSSSMIGLKKETEYKLYEEIIKENIEYDHSVERFGKKWVDEAVAIMLNAVCSEKEYLKVNGENIPQNVVKSQLLKLDTFHIEYVFDVLSYTTTRINNIKNYMLTVFYNAPNTIDSYYSARVRHDLYGNF